MKNGIRRVVAKNAKGNFDAVIYQAGNDRGIVLTSTALQDLKERVAAGQVKCYLQSSPDTERKYTLDKYFVNYPEDAAARVLELHVIEKGGVIDTVIAEFTLNDLPKNKIVRSLLSKAIMLNLDMRVQCNPKSGVPVRKGVPYNVAYRVTGLYFNLAVEREIDNNAVLA